MRNWQIMVLVVWFCAQAATAENVMQSRLNILFIVADDLATRLGCYGDPLAQTPNLDRLAREGVIFNRAYCQGEVCTPSRTSFMLGLYSRHAKANHFVLHPETMTMGRWLRQNGYQTCSIGKIDHDDPMDKFVDPQAWDVRVKREDISTTALRRQRIDEDGDRQRKAISFIGLADDPRQLTDWARVERARHFLAEERDLTKPFLLAVGFHSPHGPWDSMRTTAEKFDLHQFVLDHSPEQIFQLPKGSLGTDPGYDLSDERQRELLRGYYAAVSELDTQIGRLLNDLKERNLWDQTVIIFTSDHGYHLGWRGQWMKHSLSEQVMRVPLIVRHPKAPVGNVVNGIVELLDLFPTFCDFANKSSPPDLDGRSFAPMVFNSEAPGKAAAFCDWGNGRTARDEQFRLIQRRDGSRELYDYNSDPQEYRNVIHETINATVITKLQGLLDQEFGVLQLDKKTSKQEGNL